VTSQVLAEMPRCLSPFRRGSTLRRPPVSALNQATLRRTTPNSVPALDIFEALDRSEAEAVRIKLANILAGGSART
jgi:hypothetical protein